MESKVNQCPTANGKLSCRQVGSYVIEHKEDLIKGLIAIGMGMVIGRTTSKKESTYKFAPVNIMIGNFPKFKR